MLIGWAENDFFFLFFISQIEKNVFLYENITYAKSQLSILKLTGAPLAAAEALLLYEET